MTLSTTFQNLDDACLLKVIEFLSSEDVGNLTNTSTHFRGRVYQYLDSPTIYQQIIETPLLALRAQRDQLSTQDFSKLICPAITERLEKTKNKYQKEFLEIKLLKNFIPLFKCDLKRYPKIFELLKKQNQVLQIFPDDNTEIFSKTIKMQKNYDESFQIIYEKGHFKFITHKTTKMQTFVCLKLHSSSDSTEIKIPGQKGTFFITKNVMPESETDCAAFEFAHTTDFKRKIETLFKLVWKSMEAYSIIFDYMGSGNSGKQRSNSERW